MYIPCDKTFPWVPKFLTSDLDLEVWPTLKKNFILGHSFLTRRGRTFICTFLMARPFHGYQNFLPSNFDLEVWPTLKNFNLGHSFLTRRGRDFILHMCIPCSKTFNAVPWFLTYWLWPWRLTYFKNCPGLWLLNQRGYLLLLFTYGCRRRAMLSFWQLWFWIFFAVLLNNRLKLGNIQMLSSRAGVVERSSFWRKESMVRPWVLLPWFQIVGYTSSKS